jgi:nitroreductase
MIYTKPVAEIIRRRFSCRTYDPRPIEEKARRRLQEFMAPPAAGPLGSTLRFQLLAATEEDRNSLRGLGTYGFIRGETGFIAGAARRSEKFLEDYGYCLERIILLATDLGLGTCWLGGSFTKSGFAKKIVLRKGEELPAVASIGNIADAELARRGEIRRRVNADRRLPWESLFFEEQFGVPLDRAAIGAFAGPLEMVRLGPSASNKQPWRIVRQSKRWHFYMQRTKGYRHGFAQTILQLADLQRIDLGIAMCHFDLAAREEGLRGGWIIAKPPVATPDRETEYIVSWLEQDSK